MLVTLITGGARSGKSQYAERLVLGAPGRPTYIATAMTGEDAEMAERIRLHRARRGVLWSEREAAGDLVGALRAVEGSGAVLVDCLTLWLSGVMVRGENIEAATQSLLAHLETESRPVVCVTSEVGLGIVPDNALAREFRDRLGLLNQAVGAVASSVVLVVAGQGLRIK